MSKNIRKAITPKVKEQLLARQLGCCNNRPGNQDASFNIPGKGKYLCPLWKLNGFEQGKFDESGYPYKLQHRPNGPWQLFCHDPSGAKIELNFDSTENLDWIYLLSDLNKSETELAAESYAALSEAHPLKPKTKDKQETSVRVLTVWSIWILWK